MLRSAEHPAFSFFCFFSYPVAQTDKGSQRGRMRIGAWSGRGSTHRPRNHGICCSDLMREGGPPTDPKPRSSTDKGSGEKHVCTGYSFSIRGNSVLQGPRADVWRHFWLSRLMGVGLASREQLKEPPKAQNSVPQHGLTSSKCQTLVEVYTLLAPLCSYVTLGK